MFYNGRVRLNSRLTCVCVHACVGDREGGSKCMFIFKNLVAGLYNNILV